MHRGSLVRLDLNEVIALLAVLGGKFVQTGRPNPSALINIDAAGPKKVHRFFVLIAAVIVEILFDGGLFPSRF